MNTDAFDKFSDEVEKAFKNKRSEARLKIGEILDSSDSTGTDILSDLYGIMDIKTDAEHYEVTQFKNGDKAAKFYIAAYYWLHKSKHKKAIRNQVDDIVFGFAIDFDKRYGEKTNKVISVPPTVAAILIALTAPFIWPEYILKEKAKAAEKELSTGNGESIWLNPYNHHSIPFEGRDAEIKRLDDFMEADGNFLTTYVIAPSGAGKTRLVSQWMRKYVADPDDTEGLKEKIVGWDAGLVESRDAQVWKDWKPQCNTLIVIDYTYNYDEVIKAIADKATENHNQIIRLLILDHVKPNNMSSDIAYGKATGDSRSRGTSGDFVGFEHTTINLTPNKKSPEVLSKIIARVATLFSSNAEDRPSDAIIQKATNALLAMEGENTAKAPGERKTESNATHHPLFAALMGQTLGLNPDGDVTKLKRRDLIDQYFDVDHRIPWKDSEKNAYWDNLGAWIGCYVSVATLLRGAEFDRLHKYLPVSFDGILNKPKAADIISQISGRLVANEDRDNLKPFEPDILGETFFLKFLDECKLRDDVMGEFYKMLGTFGTREQEIEAASNFLETIQRLVRNLINDDQGTEFSEDAWRNLGNFLKPEKFPENSFLRQLISISIIDIIKQFEKAGFGDEYINKFSASYNIDDMIALSETSYSYGAASSAIRYSEWLLGRKQFVSSDQDHLLTILRNFNNQYNDQANALILIVHERCHSILKRIFTSKFHIDINRGTKDSGWTALMMACYEGHLGIATILIDNGADINQRMYKIGTTALMAACERDHHEIATLLIDRGAEVNQCMNDNYTTPLMIACFRNYIEIAALLIRRGADVNRNVDNSGSTVLIKACEEGYLGIVALLTDKGADINQGLEVDGKTALMLACEKGYLSIAALLIDKGAEVEQCMDDNITAPLTFACRRNHHEIADLLISRGAGVNPNLNAIELVVGISLSKCLFLNENELRSRINRMRMKLVKEFGLSIPKIVVTECPSVGCSDYSIIIFENTVASSKISLNDVIVISDLEPPEGMKFEEVIEPAFNIKARRFANNHSDGLKNHGYSVIEPLLQLVTHLSETIKGNLEHLFTRKDLHLLLDKLDTVYIKLLDEIYSADISTSTLLHVFKLLLAERVSVRNTAQILEAIAEITPFVKKAEHIVTHVRSKIGRQICDEFIHDEQLNLVHLANYWEKEFTTSFVKNQQEEIVDFKMRTDQIEKFSASASNIIKELTEQRLIFAIVTSPENRIYIKMILKRVSPSTPVISMLEIPKGIKVNTVGTIQ